MKKPFYGAFSYNLRRVPIAKKNPSIRLLRGAKHTAIGCTGASAQWASWLFDYWLVRYEVDDCGSDDECNQLTYDHSFCDSNLCQYEQNCSYDCLALMPLQNSLNCLLADKLLTFKLNFLTACLAILRFSPQRILHTVSISRVLGLGRCQGRI
jgi:hypothetical protein